MTNYVHIFEIIFVRNQVYNYSYEIEYKFDTGTAYHKHEFAVCPWTNISSFILELNTRH
jgi:hypothetical protein